ncbi:MAG: ABC transporter ATP-binding protein, partial [Chloroflexi bacterium]|nr:ABC transporter ATP-binding protein [Chloroflexota bacterium]
MHRSYCPSRASARSTPRRGCRDDWRATVTTPPDRPWKLLSRYVGPLRSRVAFLGLLLSANIVFQLAGPQLLRRFIDSAVAGADWSDLVTTSVLFIVVALAGQAASAGSRYLAESVGLAATNRLRHDLALHCLRLDPTFHKTRTPGEMIERIDGDTGALSAFFAQFVVGVLANAVLLVGIVVLLYRVDVRVGLAMTAFVVVALAVLWLVRGLAVPHFVAVRQARAEFFGFLGETLSGTEDIRANGAVPWVMSRFHAALRRWFPLQRRAEMAGYAVWMASIFLFALGTAGSLALSAYLYFSGAVTIGTVYLIYNYTQLIRRPLEQIRTYLQELQ